MTPVFAALSIALYAAARDFSASPVSVAINLRTVLVVSVRVRLRRTLNTCFRREARCAFLADFVIAIGGIVRQTALERKWYDDFMIRELRGTVTSTDLSGAVVDVSGWGVFVYLPDATTLAIGSAVHLKTFLSIRQDGVDLYGFESEEDRHFFEQLLSVPGVGPKTAMSILRKAPRVALMGAIGARDLDYLTRVIGLGKKAAEKLLVELSEKVGVKSMHDDEDTEVFDTLVALGYTEREARKTLSSIPSSVVGKDARLKAALTSASR